MLQGFYWESYRHGHIEEYPELKDKLDKREWYQIVKEEAPTIRQGRFDLIWLLPPSYAGDVPSAGQEHNEKGSSKKNYAALYERFGPVSAPPWTNRAVTFLENHDTGVRYKEDGSPQKGKEKNSFEGELEVEQGYAYILTHPGVPTVFWKHYFDWGEELQGKINDLVNARKVAGVHAGSRVDHQESAKEKSVYAARVVGKHGFLCVRIGGEDKDWNPKCSKYEGYTEHAPAGLGWKVWVGFEGNKSEHRKKEAIIQNAERKREDQSNRL